MSNFYQTLDAGHFDYHPYSLDGIPNKRFRGPAIDPAAPFIACVGAAQTFGRFTDRPFSQILGERLHTQVLNLGVGGAGPRLFLKKEFLDWINRARLVIVQVLSGRSESNSFFDNNEAGMLHGIRLADNAKMRFDRFLEDLIRAGNLADVRRALAETRQNYVANMVELLSSIHRPKILLWLSTRGPDYEEKLSSAWGALGAFPHLVNRSMIDQLKPHADRYVEIVSQSGLPQTLWPATTAIDGTQINGGVLVNRYYPSPEMHGEAGNTLAAECTGLMQRVEAVADHDRVHSKNRPPVPFVILAAERTGTNLLREMLCSHPDCFLAGEVFNSKMIASGDAAGIPESAWGRLQAMRDVDPVGFAREVLAGTGTRCTAAGFKLMYDHARRFPMVLEALEQDRSIRIIHIRRRNLLRRYLSNARALKSGQWLCREEAKRVVVPAISGCLSDIARDIKRIQDHERAFEARFSNHSVLNLWYEDLSESPTAIGQKAAEFLGLRPDVPLQVRTIKTGSDSLRALLQNYSELKTQCAELLSYFDEE